MNYQSDIIIGLQNLKEGKTTMFTKLLQENYYDLCIKVNGGTEKSFIIYKNEHILLKEIPYSILFGIDTYISDNCIINFQDLQSDIEILRTLNISLKHLFISNNAIIVTNKNICENSNNISDKLLNINTMIDKFENKCIKVNDLSTIEYYYLLLNNSISKVDTYKFVKKYNKVLAYQFFSFNNDIDFGNYYLKSSFHCSSSFCTNIINFKTISNIYGVCSVYEISENINSHNTELDQIQTLDNPKNYYDWLDLDNLIKNININNINILLFTKIDILGLINKYNVYYIQKLTSFNTYNLFKLFLKDKINIYCNVSHIEFDFI